MSKLKYQIKSKLLNYKFQITNYKQSTTKQIMIYKSFVFCNLFVVCPPDGGIVICDF